MNHRGWQIVAIVLLVVLGLPTGLCSLYFTPYAVEGLRGTDALGRSIGTLAAVMSATGYLIAGLTIYFVVRTSRSTRGDGTPPAPGQSS